jgi:HK97 family phage portal protein
MLKFLRRWGAALRGKSSPDPNTGGWDMLTGLVSRMTGARRANEIWQNKTTPELEQLYELQLVVYACIRKICVCAQEAPLRMGAQKRGGWRDLPNHSLQGLLNQPNPRMSYAEFQWHFFLHWLATGTSHVWKWRNFTGEPNELWPLPTSWVKPVVDAHGNAQGYEVFQGGGKWLRVPDRDMITVRFPDPRNLTAGLGPLQAALRDVQTDEARGDYIVEMLENARTPGLILKQPGYWSEEQKSEVRELFTSGLGKGRRGKPIFLEGEGATIEQQAPLKDLDWPGLSALSETRICAAFQVPPILIGLRSGLENATYSNYEMAEKSFYQGTMAPLWSLVDAAFTRGLLRDEGEQNDALQCYHDTGDVRALQDDEAEIADRAVKLFSAGLITRNRAREIVGEDALRPEQGDVFVMPMSLIETPLATDAKPAAPPADTPPKDIGSGNG